METSLKHLWFSTNIEPFNKSLGDLDDDIDMLDGVGAKKIRAKPKKSSQKLL